MPNCAGASSKLLFERHHLPVKPANWLLDLLRYPFALIRDLLTGELNLRAMGLVYTTLLSLVPLIAFAFAVLKGLGVHRDLEPLIYEFLRPIGETRRRADDADDDVRRERAGRRARFGRPRLAALYGRCDDPETRRGFQFRLARRAPPLVHAPRQRVPEPDGDRPRVPGRRFQPVRRGDEPQGDGLAHATRAVRGDRPWSRHSRALFLRDRRFHVPLRIRPEHARPAARSARLAASRRVRYGRRAAPCSPR